MRSSHSSHRSSHRSSMHSSHRSSMHSRHRSSLSHRSMHHGGSHHGSMLHRMRSGSLHRTGMGGIHGSAFRHHGISNAHAFSVGRATGVNINGSHMGAHGAALHRMRRASKLHRSTMTHHRFTSNKSSHNRMRAFSRMHNGFNSHKYTIHFNKNRSSNSRRRYTFSSKNKIFNSDVFDNFDGQMNDMGKYMWVPFLMIVPIMLFMFFMMLTMMRSLRGW